LEIKEKFEQVFNKVVTKSIFCTHGNRHCYIDNSKYCHFHFKWCSFSISICS